MGMPYLDQLGPLLPVFYAGVILACTWLVAATVGWLFRRSMRESMPHVVASANRFSAALIWVVGLVLAVQELGVATDVLLLLLGVAAVTMVVAFRAALENLGAKYFSDVYVPFKVGDTVKVGAYAGTVLEINPMSTVLLSEENQLISVPNAAFVREVVVNMTPQAWREITIPVTLASNISLPVFESEVRKSLSKLRARLDPRFPPLVTSRSRTPLVTELAITLFLRFPQDRESVTSEANRRVSRVLETLRSSRRRAMIGR